MIEILVIGVAALLGLCLLVALTLKLLFAVVKLPFLLVGGVLKVLGVVLLLALKVAVGIGMFLLALVAVLLLPLLPFVLVGLALWMFARLFFGSPRVRATA